MSVFDSKGNKKKLDDTTYLKCSIDTFQVTDGHTEFVLKVQRGPNPDNKWEVRHRFSDFVALHSTLQISGLDLPLPPKKVFGNMESGFVQERRIGLQHYMDYILKNPLLFNHLSVKKFLDPKNYSDEIDHMATQNSAMFFRSEPNWELAEPLKDIGWRIRKKYFMMKSKDSSKSNKQVLAWIEHGPDMVLDHETSLVAIMKQLTSLQHPFIFPIVYASCTEAGATIVRVFNQSGTLRDLVYKVKPNGSQLKKYSGTSKAKHGLDLSDIKRIGRQILESLKFLQDKGYPFGNLHTGNVVIDGMSCRLLDVENGVLGVPSFYRHFAVHHKKINDTESLDVYSFGHVLYEITFGEALQEMTIDDVPNNCPSVLKSVLLSILGTTTLKSGLPSLEDLIADAAFVDVPVTYQDKPTFKVGKSKEALKNAKLAIETRLKDDQKRIRQFARLSKSQSQILSEEEKKKRRKTGKKKPRPTSPSAISESKEQSATSNASTKQAATPSAAPAAPPPPPAAAPPPPPPSGMPPAPVSNGKKMSAPAGRGALLSSICDFKKGKLSKTETVDKSKPKI